ncbi:hypothetical protein HDU67_003983, partial [Dinochytrium kinnereticum]
SSSNPFIVYNNILQNVETGLCYGLDKSVPVGTDNARSWPLSLGNCDGSTFQLNGPLQYSFGFITSMSSLYLSATDARLRMSSFGSGEDGKPLNFTWTREDF